MVHKRRAAAALDALKKSPHRSQDRCLTFVLEMQEVTNSVYPGALRIAEILLQPEDFVIRHYRTELGLTSQEQHRTVDPGQNILVIITLGEAVEIV